jgi:hypothetical protein
MRVRVAVFAVLCVAACGGSDGSGVDGDKRIGELSDGERQELCEYMADVNGPERTITCSDAVQLEVGSDSVADCVAFLASIPMCPATVSLAESCTEALADMTDAQWCMNDLPDGCSQWQAAECIGRP